jgi:RNA polymerase sigma-70 factor, ECF subfamily
VSTSEQGPDLNRSGHDPRPVSVDPTFQALYERELPHVVRAVFLVSGDPQLAEDAAQEAFARALVRWRRIGSQPWIGGWVTTTALNVARRQLRRRPVPTSEEGTPLDEAELVDLRGAMRRLPARQQEAVALHYLLDLPVAETAAVMGCDEGTVKTHLARARRTLERALRLDDDSGQARRPDRD